MLIQYDPNVMVFFNPLMVISTVTGGGSGHLASLPGTHHGHDPGPGANWDPRTGDGLDGMGGQKCGQKWWSNMVKTMYIYIYLGMGMVIGIIHGGLYMDLYVWEWEP